MAVTVAVAAPSTISGCWGSSWLGKQSPPQHNLLLEGNVPSLVWWDNYPPLGQDWWSSPVLLYAVSSVNCLLLRLCSHPEAPEHSSASITCPLGTPAPRKSCHGCLPVTQTHLSLRFVFSLSPLGCSLTSQRHFIHWSKSLRSVKALPTIERSCPTKGLSKATKVPHWPQGH